MNICQIIEHSFEDQDILIVNSGYPTQDILIVNSGYPTVYIINVLLFIFIFVQTGNDYHHSFDAILILLHVIYTPWLLSSF